MTYSPSLLDRSPSLSSSHSSTSSSPSLATPAMAPASTFTPQKDYDYQSNAIPSPLSSNTPLRTSRGSIGNLASLSRTTRETPVKKGSWTPTHRAAGTSSVDSTRTIGGLAGLSPAGRPSPALRMGGLRDEGEGDKVAAWRIGSATSSPTSRALPQLPTLPSSRSASPNPYSPYGTSSSPSFAPASPGGATSDRILSSSIFSSAPLPGSQDSGLTRNGSFARGHRRANTLPHLGAAGLPVPAPLPAGEAQVIGLPGRARLSRPAESSSPFAPSNVFPSHGAQRQSTLPLPASPTPYVIPSQATRAIDRKRHDLVAYEYLCHVAEAKEWLGACIPRPADADTPLWGDGIGDFEQGLRNGYALAHLARSLGGPEYQSPTFRIFNHPTLQYRHTDNIDGFFKFVVSVGLPEIFRFETLDLYNAKNLPKVIYCLHALSIVLAHRGIAVGMSSLVDKIDFTDDEVKGMQKDLSGVRMPNFKGIGKALSKTVPEVEVETDQQLRDRKLWEATPSIIQVQAHWRGILARRYVQSLHRHRAHSLAAAESARLDSLETARLAHEAAVQAAGRTMVGLQAHGRAALARRRIDARVDAIGDHYDAYLLFQAHARGAIARRRYDDMVGRLGAVVLDLVGLQATIRGALARRALLGRITTMKMVSHPMIGFQAHVRGFLARAAYAARRANLRHVAVVRSVGGLQNLARAVLVRRSVEARRQQLGFVAPNVVGIQAQIRGVLARNAFLDWQNHIEGSVPTIVHLQSIIRGTLARRRVRTTMQHFQHNIASVTRLQAAIRSRQHVSQYRQLRMGVNVPISTIKNFVRLLDDSEYDYREELLVESTRKDLMGAIKEAQELDDDLKNLDTKIALLVKNKSTHEVARSQRLAPTRRDSILVAANDPFASNNLDQVSQRKLERYQQLFWHLQTSPAYLARLYASMGTTMSDKEQNRVEAITLVVFGHAQNQREEFLLLKLFQTSIQEELQYLPNVEAFARADLTFIRLLMQYGRGANQQGYLKSMLGPQVESIIGRADLDLGSDPVAIYRSEIAKEETMTGVASMRPTDVTYLQAIGDATTRKIFTKRLLELRAATDCFLTAIYASTRHMPFGVRYVAREVKRGLEAKFPQESPENILRVVCHLIYYRFIQPAAVAPETFGIILGVVPPMQRKNLGEVCKLLNQISVGRLFGDEQKYLRPLNDYIHACAVRFASWVRDEVIDVSDAEIHFHADEYIDAAAARRPVIYISPTDIYAMHGIITANMDSVIPERNDPLRKIMHDLGRAPSSSNDAELERARADVIPLTLSTRIATTDDPQAALKALFNKTKRQVLAILKVHHAADLEALLAKPVTEDDEDAWGTVVMEDIDQERRQAAEERRRYVESFSDIQKLSFAELKAETIRDIIQLRQAQLVDRTDKYQSILNAIASDIRSKHHRRVQRRKELSTMQTTLTSLKEKRRYLRDQIKSYQTYIDQSMTSIQKNKGKNRFVLPWSIQGVHQRKLEKDGKSYAFGSYAYSAQKLADRGILLSIDDYSPKLYNQISFTISSKEVGIFEVAANALGVKVTTVELELGELLDMQYHGKQTMKIGGVAVVNLNLMVSLINKKFSG